MATMRVSNWLVGRVVDTEGLPLAVQVYAASVQDSFGAGASGRSQKSVLQPATHLGRLALSESARGLGCPYRGLTGGGGQQNAGHQGLYGAALALGQ